MARQPRLDIAGGVYHVMMRGGDRALLFRDDEERELFLERVGEVLEWAGAECLGWALMPNHVHLILVRGLKPLSRAMHRIGSWWASRLNRVDGRRSARLDGRYKAVLVDADEYLLELVRYVHLNPVKAGLVSLADLAEHPFTGHAALMGAAPGRFLAVDEVLALFGTRRREARAALAAWVAEGLREGCRAELVARLERRVGGPRLDGEVDSRVLGDAAFVERVQRAAEEEEDRRVAALAAGWTPARLMERACWRVGVSPDEVAAGRRHRAASDARALTAWLGRKELGLSGRSLARLTGVGSAFEAQRRGERVATELGVGSLADLPTHSPRAKPVRKTPPLATIVEAAARHVGVSVDTIRSGRRGRASRARRLVAAIAVAEHGYTRRATADAMGCTGGAVTRALSKPADGPELVAVTRLIDALTAETGPAPGRAETNA